MNRLMGDIWQGLKTGIRTSLPPLSLLAMACACMWLGYWIGSLW